MIHDLKPYPKYKDSGVPWLGKVPEHWKQLPGRACFTEKKVPNIGLQEKTVLSLSYGQIVIKPPEKLHGLVPESFETYQIIEPNDIIIRSTDLQNDQNSLRFGFAKTKGIITSAYMCFQTQKLLIPEYGHLLLHTYDLMKIFYGLGSGLRQNLDWRDFKYLPCSVPPLSEQSAIVHYLDLIDRRIRRYIRAKKELIKLLEEQKQAIIHQAVTRGLDPNVKLKTSGVEWLGEIPEHWEVLPLKALSTVQSGITLGKQYIGQKLVEFPYLRVANVQEGHVNLSEIKTIEVPAEEATRSRLQKGDVLMTEGGDPDKLGRGCVWEGQISPCLHQNHIFAVRPNISRLKPYYLGILLSSQYSKEYFLRTGKQTTNLASTNKTTIGQFPIPLPKVEEQDLILDKVENDLEGIERAISGISREISILREYRTRLIAEVVTGKLDVREAATNLPDKSGEMEVEDNFEEETIEESLEEVVTEETVEGEL